MIVKMTTVFELVIHDSFVSSLMTYWKSRSSSIVSLKLKKNEENVQPCRLLCDVFNQSMAVSYLVGTKTKICLTYTVRPADY